MNFQMALRTGYALPVGSVDDGESMDDSFSGQIPLIVDLGAKSEAIFVGGYFGLGFGGTAGRLNLQCSEVQVNCSATSFRGGFEFLAYFGSGKEYNPWIGYGVGYESTRIGISGPGGDASVTLSGPEFARFLTGVDFRLNDAFSLGLLVDFSLGEYTRVSAERPGSNQSGEVARKTIHEWLTFGVRGVLSP